MAGKYKSLTIKRKNLQQGAELVEHAITLLYFMIMFFVIFEGVRLIYSFTSATYLVNDAVRYSIVRGANADTEDVDNDRSDIPATDTSIKEYLKSNKFINLQNQHIDVVFVDGNNNPGSRIRIAINYPFVPALPMLGERFGFDITIPSVAEGVIVY